MLLTGIGYSVRSVKITSGKDSLHLLKRFDGASSAWAENSSIFSFYSVPTTHKSWIISFKEINLYCCKKNLIWISCLLKVLRYLRQPKHTRKKITTWCCLCTGHLEKWTKIMETYDFFLDIFRWKTHFKLKDKISWKDNITRH